MLTPNGPGPARDRLETLRAGVPPSPGGPRRGDDGSAGWSGGWSGQDESEGVDAGPVRRGWPTAPPGTPAARLRLTPAPAAPVPAAPAPGWDGSWQQWTSGSWDDTADEGAAAPDGGDPWEQDHDRDGWARRTTEHWAGRWLPASWRGARWDPGRAGAVALAAVAAVAAVVAAIGVWSGRPTPEAVPGLPSVSASAPASGTTSAAPADGPIVVSVSGKVTRPGLVRLPAGSRVGEAVSAAGGARPGVDLTGLNLAQRLADGEQVVVGAPPPAAAPAADPASGAGTGSAGSAGSAMGGSAPGGKVDLNTATLEQLDALPGVGPVTAQKILDWRTQHGRFTSVDQLQEVGGIGQARLATLRPRVAV